MLVCVVSCRCMVDVMCLSGTNEDVTSTSPTGPRSSVDPSYDLSMEFVRLQSVVGRVAMADEGAGMVAEDKFSVGSDTVFVTMLKYVMSAGQQSTGFDQMRSLSRAVRRVTDCIEVLDNVTLSRRSIIKTLMSPWNEVPHHVLLARGNLSSQVVNAFESCRQQFASVSNAKRDTGAEPLSAVDDMFRQYMNKTLETVAKLSHTVQTTLSRMKTLPEELFAANKTAKKIGHKLTEAVNKLNSKVQWGWKHFANKFEDVRKKWFGHGRSKMQRDKKNKEHRRHDKKDTGSDRFPGKPFMESDGKVEDRKKSYKQTKSAQRHFGPQKHVEDFSGASQLDDFFEDNQRAWRKRILGLSAHIERLSDELFRLMDDDDVESILEDLKDIGDDLEKRDITEDVRTWMSCQLRWWKTRIHRKHRTEELVKGCGRQLMHWQLRVLCQQMNDDQRQTNRLPFRHPCHDVMTRTATLHLHDILLNKLPTAEDRASSEKADEFSETTLLNETCSDWYFRRVQGREDRRLLSPQWYFDRVEDRQFSRGDANWYVCAMRHNSGVYPVTSHDRQRPSDGRVKGHD